MIMYIFLQIWIEILGKKCIDCYGSADKIGTQNLEIITITKITN